MAQLLVFAGSPANQRLADIPLDGPERRRHEASIVVDPAPKFRIDHSRQILNGFCGTSMQSPAADLIADFLCRILRDGRTETTKDLPFSTVRFPRPKGIPQKVELLVLVSPRPVAILAIDHFRLFRMKFQSALLQPCRYVDTHCVRFPLCPAMNNNIVRVSLKRQMLPIAPHPQIERIVQKQIGQQLADDSSLRSAAVTLQ